MSTTVSYKGNNIATVNNDTKTLTTQGKYLEADIVLTDVSQGSPTLQTKSVSITPSTSAQSQTVTPDSGYDGLAEVDVNVAAMSQGALFASRSLTLNPTMSITETGAVSAVNSLTQRVFPISDSGYLSSMGYQNIVVSGSASLQLDRQDSTRITPTKSEQTAVAAGKYTTGAVVVNPIPSQYIVPTGTKSINANGTGIDVTEYAAVDVAVPSSAPTLQSKTLNVSSAGTTTVTPDTGYDGLDEVEVNVPSGVVQPPTTIIGTGSTIETTVNGIRLINDVYNTPNVTTAGYISSGTQNTSSVQLYATCDVNPALTENGATITAPAGYYSSNASKAVASGTAGTPTATKGTVSNHSVSVTPSVTNTTGYITGSTKTGTAVTVSASELVSGTVNITSSGNTDVTNYATASVASGSATASATKGTVSNHSVTVTPSVTRTAGYITAGSSNGTAVSVSASELVSGSQTITQNGTVDVTNLASVTVAVEGGGGSGMSVATATTTPSTASASIQFTGLSGEPTSFVVTSAGDLATGASPYKTAAVVFDGTDLHGQIVTNTSNANASYSTSFTKSYSNGTLTITGTGTNFQANQYKLVYTYGGNSANLGTAETQVGSGATSVTFTGLSDEPDYFSVIFKSDFGTSSGYQRVMSVAYDGTNTYGVAMDSGAKALSSWSYTYNNGSLTVSSNGTNDGGYFHQPGYYQLTYGVGGTVEPVEIEVEPLSVTANGTYTAPTGKAYSPVTVNVSGGGGSVNVATTTWTNTSTSTVSHQFTGLSGTPKAAFLRCTTQLTRSSSNTYYYIADIVWDGTNTSGNYHLRSSGAYTDVPSTGTAKYNVSVGTNSITFSSTATSRSSAPGSFYNGTYELTYIY